MGETTTRDGAKVTVTPEEFHLVKYDAGEIAAIAAEMAERLGVSNPIHVVVDETTPLSKLWAAVDGDGSSDDQITIHAESGAFENTQRFTTFGADAARESVGRMLLRARDRMQPGFGEVAPDVDLSLAENAAWDAYCVGRLARAGLAINQQRWRYNYRNRWGFSDEVDTAFDRLWAADGLTWADVTAELG